MPSPSTLLVTAATGKQGGALINALLASPSMSSFHILALTRKAASPSATKLAAKAKNITIIEGSLDDPRAVFASARNAIGESKSIDSVYSVQPVLGGDEETRGKELVDAALENGVSYFVYSSVERGEGSPPTNVPHFAHKHNIEEHLMARSAEARKEGKAMNWTIFRPVAFMDNLTPDFAGKLFPTAWQRTLGGTGIKLQLISCADIGVVAAQAFLQPESPEYQNKAISLAGDYLTFEQANEIFREKIGVDMPTTFGPLVGVAMWMMKDLGMMFQWFKDVGFAADVEALRKEYKLTSWADFVEERKAGWTGK